MSTAERSPVRQPRRELRASGRRAPEEVPQEAQASELQRLQAAVGNRGMQQLLGGVRGLIGEGTPLPAAVREETEARLGADLSGVRVHDHAGAHALAQQQLARAFTLGNDVVFNRGRYQPGSADGRHLLAHELTHVVQQTRGGPAAAPGPVHEAAADRAASALGRGEAGAIDAGPAARHGVQCVPLSEAEIAELSLERLRARVAENEAEASNFVNSEEYNTQLARENLLLKDRAMELARRGASGKVARGKDAPAAPRDSEANASRVENLSNEDLISALATGIGWDRSLLEREQERRARLGHKWLEEPWLVAPSRLVRLYPQGGATQVMEADMALALGPPTDVRDAPILSEHQLSAFLAANGIPVMTKEEYLAARAGRTGALGALGGDLYLQGVQRADASSFARPLSTTRLGQRAEFGKMANPLFGDLLHYDFNNRGWVDSRGGVDVLHVAAERNFPIVDLRSRVGGLNQSLKVSLQAPSGRYAYYAEGLGDLTGGSRPDLFSTMLDNLPGGGTTPAEFLRSAQLLIPPDDVAAFRALLSNPTARMTPKGRLPLYRVKSFTPIFDGLLAVDPVRTSPGGPTYDSVAALDAAVKANAITQAQMDAVLQQRGLQAADMVAGHNESLADLTADVNLRGRTGSEASTRNIAGPEYVAATRYSKQYGSWGAGVTVGSLGAAPRGGAMGAVVAVITDTGVMLFDGRDNPEAIERLERSAGYGFLGGSAGAATEFAVQSELQRRMAATALSSAAPTVARSTLAKGMGGAAGGGVASIAVETWQIATEEGPHSGEEIALRESRALVIGATSGFLATVAGSAATGALVGTVAPGVGNAVGLVVGLLVGVGIALVAEATIPRPARTRE